MGLYKMPYKLKTLDECYKYFIKEDTSVLQESISKDEGLYYLVSSSRDLLENICNLKQNQAMTLEYILEGNDLDQYISSYGVPALSKEKFEKGQDIIRENASRDIGVYGTQFRLVSENYTKIFCDSYTTLDKYDKFTNTNCLGTMHFIFTSQERFSKANLLASVGLGIGFAATVTCAVSGLFGSYVLNKIVSAGLLPADYAQTIPLLKTAIGSIFGYDTVIIPNRSKQSNMIDSICKVISRENKENLEFRAVYFPVLTDIGELYRRAYPFSKEFMVKIIAYERPKKK